MAEQPKCAACGKRLYASAPMWVLSNGLACCVRIECWEQSQNFPAGLQAKGQPTAEQQ
jgi:hypothetical protein